VIFTGTYLSVCDNSGVKWVQCLKVLKQRPKNFGKIGDFIVTSLKSVKSLSKLKKKEIYKGIIVRTKKKIIRKDGSNINFSKNSILLLSAKNMPIGTRTFGAVGKELRIKENAKLISLCPKML